MLLRLPSKARGATTRSKGSSGAGGLTKALEWRQRTKPRQPVELCPATAPISGVGERFLPRAARRPPREMAWQAADRRRRPRARVDRGLARSISRTGQVGRVTSWALEQLDLQPAVSARLALAAVELNRGNDRAAYALRQSLANLQIANREKV
jgi:hypothetical protein